MSMTPKERVIAQIKHKETDYLPYVVRFERDYDIEARVDEYYGSDHWRNLLENHIIRIRVISDNFWTLKPNPLNIGPTYLGQPGGCAPGHANLLNLR